MNVSLKRTEVCAAHLGTLPTLKGCRSLESIVGCASLAEAATAVVKVTEGVVPDEE
jgi:hypothetical protein